MDGDQKMNIGICIEITINFIQQFVFIGFLYLFFDKNENKLKNVLSFWITVFLLFTVCNYFTFHGLMFNHIDSIIGTTVMIIYSVFFLKGQLYLRILAPIITFGLNILIANLNLAVMVHWGNMSFIDALTFSTSFRYLYIITSNLIYIMVLLILLRIGKKRIQVSKIPEIISFLLIAIIIYVAALSDMLLYEVSGFNRDILPHVVIICVSVFALAGMFWYLLLKTSRDNKLKTDLLLSKQREEMYKNSVLSTNEYIERLSHVKHDIKNNTMTINRLIADGEYNRAIELCDSISAKLSSPTLSYCDNPVLNAILNVEIEKAIENRVDLHYIINDTLYFIEDADIVSIIGNLCDNAIEYLSGLEEDKRNMNITISMYKDYHYITCKNTIVSSVLNTNPNLNTTKEDDVLHGKGLKILRDIAQKYSGEILLKEYDDELSVSVIIRNT